MRTLVTRCVCALLLSAGVVFPQNARDAETPAPAARAAGAAQRTADDLRAELASVQLDVATTRDFASAEPALDALFLRTLRAGEFDDWREVLAEVHVARVNLLLDMGRIEEAGAAAGQIGSDWTNFPHEEQSDFRVRMQEIQDLPNVQTLLPRIETLLAREDRGAADLKSVVEEALAKGDERALTELGSLAVPALLELLQPDAGPDDFRTSWDPLHALIQLEPERAPALLSERVPAPPLGLMRRLARAAGRMRLADDTLAWVGCEDAVSFYTRIDWIPWFASLVRRADEHEDLADALGSILWAFIRTDSVPPQIQDALIALVAADDLASKNKLAAVLNDTIVSNPGASRGKQAVPARTREVRSLARLRDSILHHPDARFRRIAAALFSATPDLGELRRLAGDVDPLVRVGVANAFGDVMLAASSGCPRGGRGSGSESMRMAAVVKPGDAELLHELAADPDERVQRAALTSLLSKRYGRMPASKAREIWAVATSAIRVELLGLEFSPDSEWLALLEGAFVDESPAVRLAAAERFGTGDTPFSAALLERLVEDPDPRMRAAAPANLVELEDGDLREQLLLQLGEDSEHVVREAVVAHLDALSDPDLLVALVDCLLLAEHGTGNRDAQQWLSEQLQHISTRPHPERLAELALRELRRHPSSRVLVEGQYDLRGSVSSELRSDPVGLRLLALGAMEPEGEYLWGAALGKVSGHSAATYNARGVNDPLLRDARWEAWKPLELSELNLILGAYQRRDGDALAREILTDRLELDRLEVLLRLRAPSALVWYGWLRLASEGEGEQPMRALDQLAEYLLDPSRSSDMAGAWSSLQDIDKRLRTEWVTAQIREGRSLDELDQIIRANMLWKVSEAGEMRGARRALVEAAVTRWGDDELRDSDRVRDGLLHLILTLAAPDSDLISDEHLLALAEDHLAWDAVWPAVEKRHTDAFLPLLQRVFLSTEASDDYELGFPGDAFRVLRTYPSAIAEPLLLDLAERTTNRGDRNDCLEELEQRARVRAARANFETRQLDTEAHQQALTEVLAMLDEPDALLRAEAARALGTLGSAAQLPRLIRLLRDDDASVRAAARDAIDSLHARDTAPRREGETAVDGLAPASTGEGG